MRIQSDERVFVCGKTGSGKTTLVKKLLIPEITRFVFYDPKCQEVLTDVVVCRKVEEVAEALRNGDDKIHLQPLDASDENFNSFCRVIFECGNVVLIVDEIARHCGIASIPRYFDYCIRMGRSRNIGMVLCTQRPNIVHNNVLSEAEHFFLFQQTHPNDRAKLKGVIGEPAELLNSIGRFEWVYYCVHSGVAEVFAPV